MLIILIGDSHLTGKNPVCRLDDLTELQYIKWEEIRDFANKKNAPIVSVGDIFNISVVSNSIVNKIGGILKTLKNPLYFVFGNHDLLYHSIKMVDRTSIGVLHQNNPFMKHINSFKNDYGVSWDYIDWDQELQDNESQFLLTHKAIVNNKQLESNFWIREDSSFALPVGKWAKKYKMIFCGHWHKQYSFKYKNTTIINPGPISRINVKDNLHPSFCSVNLKTGIFKRHKIESAKPFDEVISSKHIAMKENNSNDIKKFISEIGKTSKHDSTFIDNLVSLLDSHNLNREIESLLTDILSKTQERRNK